MKYCGIDLHSNNSVVIVSDEEDRIVFQNRLPNDLRQIAGAVEPYREELVGVVIESTYNWYWLGDGLMDAGYRVHLANTTAIKKYEGLKYSGDFADAAYLAQLLRLGLLPEGYIYPREQRGARVLARKRLQLVRYRTAQILSIENTLARQTGARLSGEAVKRLTAEQVEALGFVPDVRLALESNRAVSQVSCSSASRSWSSFVGKLDAVTLAAGAPKIAPGFTLDLMAKHSLDFWLTSEDLPDPDAALAKLARSLRPGGWLLAEDSDMCVQVAADPDHPDAELFESFHRRVWAHLRAVKYFDTRFGRTHPRRLRALGLEDLGCEATASFQSGGEPDAELQRRNLGQNLGPMLVERSVVSRDELDRVLALYADSSFGYLSGLGIAAWGRRPKGCDGSGP